MARYARQVPFLFELSLIVASTILFCAESAAGEPDVGTVFDIRSEYLVDFWQTEQGLPDNFITALAQSPDGYLWVGTFSGLARFNGAEFVTSDAANTPELPDSRIVDLKLDGFGRLWIRSESGRFTYWHNGGFRVFTDQDSPPALEAPTVKFSPEGNFVWASRVTDSNYLQFNGRSFEHVHGTNDFEHLFGQISDRDGYGWGMRDGKLFSRNPKNPGEWPIPNFNSQMGWRLHPSHDGGIFVIGVNGVAKFRNGLWQEFGPLPVKTDGFDGYAEDHLGNLWVGVSLGEIWRVNTNGATTRFKVGNAAISQPGKQIIEDAENNLWIGTGGRGAMRLKPRLLKSFDSRNGLASDIVRSVAAAADGTIWMATVDRVDCFRPGAYDVAEKHHAEIELPWRVYCARDGALWVGTYAEGLFRFADGKWDRYRTPRGISTPPILRLFETRSGEMYAGTYRGLFTPRDLELASCAPPNETRTLDVRALAEGPAGELYVGLNGGGVLRRSGDKWERFTTREGMPTDHVFALHVDRDGAVWIGTEGKSLSRLKNGKIFNFADHSIGLPRVVVTIIEDDGGNLWFGSNQGIYRADLRELAAVADGGPDSALVIHFDKSDGMGSSECTGAACKSPDGRLWFPTMFGVTMIDPKTLPHNIRPPPVVIEQILLDDKIAADRPTNQFNIQPGLHRMEIRFAGLSFTAPDHNRYRYKLGGYDPDWVEAGKRRAAYYTGISPGEYDFEVRAANNDGVWNQTGAKLRVIALPYFWQRRSFQIPVIILLAGAAVGLARYWTLLRVRQRMAELERRHALDKERGRISRDLHDSLGADLSQLALWSDLALQAKDSPSVMAKRAADVSKLTREVIQNVEEIVWTVNPRNDSLDKFAAYLCEFSERVITCAGLRFRWEAPDSIPPIPLASDIRHHVFLVTKEALNNIVKHSGGSEARVSLAIQNDSAVIAISDNGGGFNIESGSSGGGNGLGNMSERLAACGGAVIVESAVGIGTTIRLRIPLPNPAKP
jgi:signal transduction histidine kinase/ligand-binding sensor domain-containing protein